MDPLNLNKTAETLDRETIPALQKAMLQSVGELAAVFNGLLDRLDGATITITLRK